MSVVLPVDPAVGLLFPGGPQTRNPRYFAVPQGLIGYWGFDPDCVDFTATIAADISRNGNDGTITTQTLALGQVGSGLKFSGANQVNCPVQNLSAYTFCVWLNCTVIPSTSASQQPIVDGASGGGSWGFSWGHGNATFRQATFHQNVGSTFFAAKLTSTLAANTWYFVCGTWDGAIIRAWLNGVNEASTSAVASVKVAATNFIIGQTFPGTVDDVRLYNRALDPGEIQQLYQVGLIGRRDAMWALPPETELDLVGGGVFVPWGLWQARAA